MNPDRAHEALAREAIRLHRRYQCEVVERFSVCPWARAARLEGRIRAHVVGENDPEPGSLLPTVTEWADARGVDVGFVIVPRFEADSAAFARWAEQVGALRADVFLSASFHPDVGLESGTVRYLRRSPDPTVQLVRRNRLDEIRAADPPHYQDIFMLDLGALEATRPPRTVGASVLAHNERLLAAKRSILEGVFGDIEHDRNETYGRLRSLSPQRRER